MSRDGREIDERTNESARSSVVKYDRCGGQSECPRRESRASASNETKIRNRRQYFFYRTRCMPLFSLFIYLSVPFSIKQLHSFPREYVLNISHIAR